LRLNIYSGPADAGRVLTVWSIDGTLGSDIETTFLRASRKVKPVRFTRVRDAERKRRSFPKGPLELTLKVATQNLRKVERSFRRINPVHVLAVAKRGAQGKKLHL